MDAIILPLKVPLAPDTSPPVILPPAVILPPVVIDVAVAIPPTSIPELKEDPAVPPVIVPLTSMLPAKLAFPDESIEASVPVLNAPAVTVLIKLPVPSCAISTFLVLLL